MCVEEDDRVVVVNKLNLIDFFILFDWDDRFKFDSSY